MKKKFLSIIMTLVLIISCTASTQAEVIHYKKYKNFKYLMSAYNAIAIKYYNGKKAKVTIPEKIKGVKVRYVKLTRAKYMKEIKISRYVKEVRLSGNKQLKKVTISKKNKYLCDKNNMVLNKKKTKLMSVLGGYDEIKTPKTVKTLEINSFSRSKVTKVVLTKNVKKIKSTAFNCCKKLKEVVLEGDSIPKINENAFYSASNNINFYVKNKELAEKLLKELDGKRNFYVHIYVGDELVLEKQIEYDYNW